jgi:hypothetical protein
LLYNELERILKQSILPYSRDCPGILNWQGIKSNQSLPSQVLSRHSGDETEEIVIQNYLFPSQESKEAPLNSNLERYRYTNLLGSQF